MDILAYGKKCASWLQLSAHFSNVIFELIAATRGICYAPLRLKPTLNGIKLLSDTPPDILMQVIIPYLQIKSYFLGGYLEMITWSCLAYYLLPIFISTLIPDIIIFMFSKICKKLILKLNFRADF